MENNLTVEDVDLLTDVHKNSIGILGFWDERSKSELIKSVELTYNTSIIKHWFISDLIVNKEKFLIKWDKRFTPLEDNELKEKYGR